MKGNSSKTLASKMVNNKGEKINDSNNICNALNIQFINVDYIIPLIIKTPSYKIFQQKQGFQNRDW